VNWVSLTAWHNQRGFPNEMQAQMDQMWAAKLGLARFDEALFNELVTLMVQTSVDYTIFFRELSAIPDDIAPLKTSFYTSSQEVDGRWSAWLIKWKALVSQVPSQSHEELSQRMKLVNPKYILREWFVVPAYKSAAAGNYALTRELQDIMTQPYSEQSQEVEGVYDRRKPSRFFETGGTSHYSCSS
jgi:uncharacterized protein YdiU (UPF0061 family)